MKKFLYIFLVILKSNFLLCEAPMLESTSEINGLALLTDQDLQVYSIGISTGGMAELKMAEMNPNRYVIASTIDLEGAQFAQNQITEKGLSDQVTVTIEDISQPLPYEDAFFDFVYARLVLHYLSKDQLTDALDEIYRILKKDGKLYVVVRSSNSPHANNPHNQYDPSTGFTTYISSKGLSYSRYFHTKESIQEYLITSGFSINHVKSYEERLCSDFQRTQLSSQIDSLIEVLASK